MTNSLFIEDCLQKNRDYLLRGVQAAASVPVERLNHRPVSGMWSPAQVYKHLLLTNSTYEKYMLEALMKLPTDTTNQQVRPSFFGRLIARQAGPGPNTPAPRQFVPPDEPLPESIVEEWAVMQRTFIDIIERAKAKDLNKKFMRNPLFKDIRMNLADCFLILTRHTLRHVEQIEERVAGSC